MLNALRKSAGGVVAKVFIALLVLSFAVWGIADIFSSSARDTLVAVGETRISGEEYRQALDRELSQISRQAGRPVTLEQARQFGLDAQVLGRLVTEAVLDESGREMALGASDQAVARLIMEDPVFQAGTGRFDRAYFNELLRSNGISEEDYVESQRGGAMRSQLVQGLVGGAKAPEALTDAVHRYQNEARSIQALVLGADAAGEVGQPEDAALAAYFEENKGAFRAPEYRKLQVVTLDPESLARTIEVTDQDARDLYESQKARYTQPERREVEQVMFPDEAAAQAAYERIRNGDLFEQVAVQAGAKPMDYRLGMVTREAIVDPAIAEAAFALEPNAVSEPVKGRFGTTLVRVTRIEPGSVRPFEEVGEEIKTQIAADRARDELLGAHDTLEDERAGGATLAESAAKVGLEVRAVEAVDRQGNAPDGSPVEIAGKDEVLTQAFETDIGVEADPVALQGDGFAWVEVQDVTGARDRPLEEVRDAVVERWRQDQVRQRLTEAANGIVEAVRGGRPLAEIAAERGLDPRAIGPFKRNEQPEPLSPAAVSTVFATPEGGVASAPGAEPTQRVVFQVTGIELAPKDTLAAPQAEALQEQLATGLADDLLTQYVNRMRDDFGITIDQTALNRLTGAS